MFKKLLQLKTLLVALLVMTGAGNVWADEVTYTFTTKGWGATPANWTSGKDGGQLTQGRGIQVTTSASGANGTSPVSYSNISKIVVKYCTNADKGAGKIKVKVGDGNEQSFTVSKPSSGGTTLKNATFNFSPAETGNVKVTVNCTTNSVYIHSVTITYSSGSTTETCATPTFSPAEGTYTSAQNVTLSTTTDGATIYYTTDGTDPETSSSSYSSAIPVSATTTIKAIAVKEGMDNSDVASATYTIVSLAHAGTEEDPYTVADARTAIDANVGKTGVYAKGIVSDIVTAYSSEYNNITFDIVDENGTATLRAYRCIGTEAANVQVGDIVVVSGNLTTYNDIYEFAAGNQLISLDRKEAAVLESIALSGTYPTTFVEGSEFGHEGMTVTATYEDTSEKDVTASATFTGYDMATLGQQTVTVSYTEGEVTKTASYGITVTAVPTHNVTWSVNDETTTVSYKEGAVIEFPENPADVNGKTFVGWVTDAIEGTTDIAPSFVTSAKMGTSDMNFYAVFARLSETEGWRKIEKLDTLSAGTYAIISEAGNAFNGEINDKGHGLSTSDRFSFKDNVATSAPTGTCLIELIKVDGGFKLYNPTTEKYLYAEKASSGNLAWHNDENSYWRTPSEMNIVYNANSAYLRVYNNTFRTYAGSSNGDRLYFAMKTTIPSYSSYCTTIPPSELTITLNAACHDAEGMMVYGTYSSSLPFVVSDDVVVSEISIVNDAFHVEAYKTGDVVPANTGVMVSAPKGGNYTVNVAPTAGASVLDAANCLRPTGDNGITAEAMGADDPGCLFYRLTMHNGTQIGYWWGAENGAAFAIAPNKAYMAIPEAEAARMMGNGFSEIFTGIVSTEQQRESVATYNLLGQRVSPDTKGVLIRNGKKLINK